MKKKHFSFALIISALLIFIIVPTFNYMTDASRILHHDYKHSYPGFHPNKLSLKMIYLLENKNKYDTLVYGSSRGGFMDVSLISENAYNMSHGFGTVTTYLHSLRMLLNNGIKVKNIWIGVNDFVIWKDQESSLGSLIYKNDIIKDIILYTDWLFTLRPKHIDIIKNHILLHDTEYVTNPNGRIASARLQEKSLKEPRNIPPTTLGYTGKFRVNKAIEEIKEIKKLCDKNNIKLTVFMYPTFYKTYLRYNQYKIEEFKIKLASVLDFYDFYDLGDLAINQLNWFEGSHFVPSVSDFMIKNIQQNNFLVTKENIESRIADTRSYIKNISHLPSLGKIYVMNTNIYIDLDSFKIIFDINNNTFKYFKNDHFILKKYKQEIDAVVTHPDPIFILDQTKTKLKHTIMSFSIECSQKTFLSLYFKHNNKSNYSENNMYKVSMKKGLNEFRLVIPSKYINNDLRVDFVDDIGKYKIKKFIIHEFD